MIFQHYTINRGYNAHNEPVTEILDRRRGTASRFLGVYTDDGAIAMLERLRAGCLKRRQEA